jgi:hypothetical protein
VTVGTQSEDVFQSTYASFDTPTLMRYLRPQGNTWLLLRRGTEQKPQHFWRLPFAHVLCGAAGAADGGHAVRRHLQG